MGDSLAEKQKLSAAVQAAKQAPLFILEKKQPGLGAAPAPAAPEPVLELDDIQGNVLPGFNKDHQLLAFLKIDDAGATKAWLRETARRISTARQVLSFNRLFKEMRQRRGIESQELSAVWINLAFSFPGIEKLTTDAAGFPEGAFRAGLPARAAILGDPTNPVAPGHPRNWLIGGDGKVPDVIVIVAGDKADETERVMRAILQWTGKGLPQPGSLPAPVGMSLIHIDRGEVLPNKGHEHFGFKDGISQPGVRGRATDSPEDFVTPRYLPQNYDYAEYFGKPGQLLIWPGEFIIGYERQHDKDPLASRKALPARPAWTCNGSYLVFRRLRQDVAAFHEFLEQAAKTLRTQHGFERADADWLGARMVGRWRSGAPAIRSPHDDNPALGLDDAASSHFFFAQRMPELTLPSDQPRTIPECLPDQAGFSCPHAGHIRKVNPRDVSTDSGSSLNRRLLRRGVPYGPPHDPADPASAARDRGLIFLAYTASIEEAFELLQQTWCNQTSKPEPGDGGHDPIIGQNPDDPHRKRVFNLPLSPTVSASIPIEKEWVIPTGGAYFFAPSLSALSKVLAS